MTALAAPAAFAQAWPDKPIRFLMSAPAGSSIDVLGRTIADKLKDRLGQPVVVENKPAAGGTVATAEVAHSAPDGYTMVLAFNGPLSFAPLLQKLPYDVAKDLAPVIITSSQPNVLAINATLPVHSVKELVAYAKANPGKLNYASVGNGSSSHLNMELFKSVAGFDAVHVPFNGSPPAVKATVQNETQMMFAVMQPLQAQIQAGQLRALAVTTGKRFPLLPDLPTIAESGYPGFEALAWNGVLVAANTPRPIIARLNAEMNAVLKEPGRAAEDARLRIRPDRRDAGGVRRADQRRSDAMGAGDQEGRPEGRLSMSAVNRGQRCISRQELATFAHADAAKYISDPDVQRSGGSRKRGGTPMSDVDKVVLAYSGGLDTSVILKWLQDTYGCEVVTFTADIGQGEEVEPARAKALQLGIKKKNIYIEDLREEFVRDFVFPMFRANAVYEGEYLLGTSIARPLIAKRLVEIARKTGADAISHGATGKGNDQVRFELGAYALAPNIRIIAPWREWDLLSREKLLAYADQHGIPVDFKKRREAGGAPYSMDANLLHISYEGGILEDPDFEPEESMWRMTVSPEKRAGESADGRARVSRWRRRRGGRQDDVARERCWRR